MINPSDLDRHITGNWGEDSIQEDTQMNTLRETYRETRQKLSDAYLDFNSLPSAYNYRKLYDAMNAHQEAFQAVLDAQEKALG